MAVYCGVCAIRIACAPENGGSFSASEFGGWDDKSRISDTCEDCAAVLCAAVTRAAGEIAQGHRARIDALRDAVTRERSAQKAYEHDRRVALAEFERKRRESMDREEKT